LFGYIVDDATELPGKGLGAEGLIEELPQG